jgi:hypothetical protein
MRRVLQRGFTTFAKKILRVDICIRARATGRRAVVVSAPISTYGVEAPAARAHDTCFRRYVGVVLVRRLESVWIDSFPVLPVPILGDALHGGDTTRPRVLACADVPEGRLFLHSSSISFWVCCIFDLPAKETDGLPRDIGARVFASAFV